MKFTKEEVSLCKQVAEKKRKPFKWGDWYYFKKKVHLIWSKPEPIMDDSCIPLWTISDCLEFLRERGIRFAFYHDEIDKYYVDCGYDNKRQWSDIVAYKTPLEACLKAVLAVVEEKK